MNQNPDMSVNDIVDNLEAGIESFQEISLAVK
jgi:hypothetical protein